MNTVLGKILTYSSIGYTSATLGCVAYLGYKIRQKYKNSGLCDLLHDPDVQRYLDNEDINVHKSLHGIDGTEWNINIHDSKCKIDINKEHE